MDARKAVTAGLFVLMSSTACAPWGALTLMGVVGGASAELPQTGGSEPVDRARLGRIFRDGRYTFEPAPPAVKRSAERSFRSDPLAEAALEKLSVKIASGGAGETGLLTVAIVWSDLAAEDPATWEGFLRGYKGNKGVELRSGKQLRGVEVAFGRQSDANVVLIDYSGRVTLMVAGPPGIPFGPLKDLARYLLRGR